MKIFSDTDCAYKNLERHTLPSKTVGRDDSFLIIILLLFFLIELKDKNELKT